MYRNSKHTVIFPLILSAGVVLGILLGQYLGRHDTASQIRGMLSHMSVPSNKLTYTLSLIENRYVDSVSMDSLAEHVIPLLVRELDPHSVYIPASEMAALNEPLEGEFDGIGVVFNMATDTVIVLNVIPHGPSDKAGVKAGDRIVEIGDSLVAGRKIPQNEVVKMLRGPRGSKVRLGLGRQGIDGLVEVEVERGIIPIRSVESAFRIVDGIGYVKLGQFARTTAGEFRAALDTLRAQGVSKLIFDLRGNSGGFLDQAIAVANEFLHEGQLIVYTEDRRHEQLREYADGTGSAQEMEVAVLIDEASASSSEILAGALQDNDRGTIVGRRSFGKGLVQQQIPYADGSALRLTTARYYTPTGRSIQKPDVFVPADTTDVTKYFIEVAGRNILYRYTIEYADRHRDALNAVRTIGGLDSLLDGDRRLFDDFIAYAARKGVAPRYDDIARSHKLIEAQLRAYIGRNTSLEDDGFYAQIYPVDDVIVRAIGILNGKRDD